MASSLAIENRIPRERRRLFAIAVLNEADFYRLKSERPAFQLPDHYEEWLDERDGLLIGLSAAGVRAVHVRIDLDKFLAWDAPDRALDEAALDRFAASTKAGASARGDFAVLAEHASSVGRPCFRSFN